MSQSNSDAGLSAAQLTDLSQTRMTALLSLLERLLETDLQGDQREFAETIDREARALLHSINQNLDSARLEAPAPPTDLVPNAPAPEVVALHAAVSLTPIH